jgi:hypothetical protein
MSKQSETETTLFVHDDPHIDLSSLVVYGDTDVITLAVSSFSSLCCILNIAVLAHPKLKEPLYKYLLIISAIDFIYLFQFVAGGLLDVLCRPRPFMCGEFAHPFVWWFGHVELHGRVQHTERDFPNHPALISDQEL